MCLGMVIFLESTPIPIMSSNIILPYDVRNTAEIDASTPAHFTNIAAKLIHTVPINIDKYGFN